MSMVPMVIEQTSNGERGYDIYSRMLKERIIYMFEEVTEHLASSMIAQLQFLEAEDPGKEIRIYINSPGGSVYDGFAIYDAIQSISSPVSTICTGLAASMGAFLLAAGSQGRRKALPHSRIMIHQVSSGSRGTATDLKIHLEETLALKEELNRVLHSHTNNKVSFETLVDMMERDKWLSAQNALDLGLIDAIIKPVKVTNG